MKKIVLSLLILTNLTLFAETPDEEFMDDEFASEFEDEFDDEVQDDFDPLSFYVVH